MFDWNMRVPIGYTDSTVTLRRVEEILSAHYERASIRRHLALLHSRGGNLGIGSTWRVCPHPISAASMRCESFHQNQEYANGFVGASAIDYVWKDGPDAGNAHDGVPDGGVPVQGSAEAKTFGIHANVGIPGTVGFESWHGQPIEIDGWASATGNGAHPAPTIDPDYPLPPEHDPYPSSPEVPKGDEMKTLPQPYRAYDSRLTLSPLKPGETRTVVIGMTNEAFINLTVIGQNGTAGHVSVNDTDGSTSLVNYDGTDRLEANTAPVLTPNGRIEVTNFNGTAHIIVDVFATG